MVLFVGGVTGLYFGLNCGWQIAVESAQVVAGIVEYPVDNPFYMYHVKAWTLLHQVPALLLACGLSERVVSLLIACTASILFQQAFGLICYSFSRDRLISCAVPMLYLATNVCKLGGAVYPVFLEPHEYWTTYGVTGTAMALFVWSLWGLGLWRAAALLSGLSPAVHPALGGWCIAMTVLALAWNRQLQPRKLAPWFGAGLAATAVSFAIQQYIASGLLPADPVLAKRIVAAFMAEWDNHRVPVPFDAIDWQFGWSLLALTAVVEAWHRAGLSSSTRLLLRILLISALVGLILCFITHLSPWLPMPVVMAMPGRFINLSIVAYPAVLIGVLCRWRRRWPIDGLLLGLSLFCLLRALMLSKHVIYVPYAHKVFIVSGPIAVYLLASCGETGSLRVRSFVRGGALAAIALAGWLWRSDLHLACLLWISVPALWLLNRYGRLSLRESGETARPLVRGASLACLWLAFALKGGWLLALGCLLAAGWALPGLINRMHRPRTWRLVAAVASLALIAVPLVARGQAGLKLFDDVVSDAAIAAARRQPGMLLIAPRLGIVQLRTRRPVLLNSEAMNQITYVPASAPAMNEIVKRVFGDDMLAPRPRGWENWGGLMPDSGCDLWQSRTMADWQQIAREFGVTDVLTGREWKLNLPLVARSEKLALFHIPAAESPVTRFEEDGLSGPSPRTQRPGKAILQALR